MRRDRVVLAATVLLQLVVLYAPSPGGPGGVPHLDKVVHAAVFAAVAWAGRRAGLPVAPLVVVLAGHAVGSELVQHQLVPGRQGDVLDAVADLVGTAVGAVLPVRRVRGPSWAHEH